MIPKKKSKSNLITKSNLQSKKTTGQSKKKITKKFIKKKVPLQAQIAKTSSESDQEDQSEYKPGGYHPVKVGDVYYKRYKILCKIGWGQFSTVWAADDFQKSRYVALKIVKSGKEYQVAVQDEISILKKIYIEDREGKNHVVRLFDHFFIKGPNGTHPCMVFELLGDKNLLGLIKEYHYLGLPVPMVKSLSKQMLIGLDYLQTKCKIIHTDIKPENVMLYYKVGSFSKTALKKLGTSFTERYYQRKRLIQKRMEMKKSLREKQNSDSSPPPAKIPSKSPIRNLQSTSPKPPKQNTKPVANKKIPEKKTVAKKELKKPIHSSSKIQILKTISEMGIELKGKKNQKSWKSQNQDQNQEKEKEKEKEKKVEISNDSLPKISLNHSSFNITKSSMLKPRVLRKPKLSTEKITSFAIPKDTKDTKNKKTVQSKNLYPFKSRLQKFKKNQENEKNKNKNTNANANKNKNTNKNKNKKETKQITKSTSTDKIDSSDSKSNKSTKDEENSNETKTQKTTNSKKKQKLEEKPIKCKIIDFGNACWVDKHFAPNIQTRQYRSPEVILGYEYTESADTWSLGCMIFELLTGDFLFNPKKREYCSKDEEHLALIMELIGDIPKELALGGPKSEKFFNSNGKLKNISRIYYLPLKDILVSKYHFTPQDSDQICSFLLPMLSYDYQNRISPAECLKNLWLSESSFDNQEDTTFSDTSTETNPQNFSTELDQN
ncbi:hypothetical protein M0811_08519 [Anaeramoeba ignava]|uniref:non-specific serine/threonine protein kinase n=1 Tax=Anaeramoeba ignava TaxID=1746090 RepID=A0A9Q0LIT2_ANAIG|nr:hypothetical protein M0811_08519 [Anaeramoeba ignava]